MRLSNLNKTSGTGIEAMPVPRTPIQCEQLFSRKGMAYLWENRESFDKSTVELLKSLWRLKKEKSIQCVQQIEYRHSTSRFGKMGYGRLFSRGGAGLERLEREVRGTLCREYYHDIDIVNCHPVLLVQYAKNKYNHDLPILTYYIEHREEVLAKLSDNRDEAKDMIIVTLYGSKTDNVNLMPMASELQKFTKFLSEQPEHKELFEECKKENNRYASFLSHILQTEEVDCMLSMKDTFETLGWSVDVLAYDGVMIRKRQDAVLNKEVFSKVEADILENTGYRVAVLDKPMTFFEILTEEKEDALTVAYNDMKAKWEINHFYFRPNNVIVEQQANGGLFSFSLEHASTAFNMWVLPEDPTKPRTDINYFLTRWNKDPERRIVNKYVFKSAAECAKDEVSLFKGFYYQSLTPCENPEAVAIFKDVVSAVCNDNEEIYNYMIKWFARMIQDPFHKPGVCPILINKKQGTGKDTVCLWIKKIMGNHVGHYQNDEDLFEKHDTRKEGGVMMYLEEVGSGVCKSKSEALKSMITSDTVSINPKGEKCYSVPNVGNFIMTTNKSDPVRIENSDRRFYPIEGSDRLLGKVDFWKSFYNRSQLQIAEPPAEWIYPVGKFLESICLTEFNVRDPPVNEYKNEIMTLSEDPVESFLKQWVGDLEINELLNEYEIFCQNNHIHCTIKGPKSFGKVLMAYRSLVAKRESSGKTIYWRR
jgi:hypothetical protein